MSVDRVSIKGGPDPASIRVHINDMPINSCTHIEFAADALQDDALVVRLTLVAELDVDVDAKVEMNDEGRLVVLKGT